MSRHARLDVLLDGVRITRSASDAARRGTERVHVVAWDDLAGVSVETSKKGRAVVRLQVRGVTPATDHRLDPFAVKAGSGQGADALAVAERIEEELRTRRRWRELADPVAPDASAAAGF